ncbi:hypothetical protein [Brevundimonas sp.]|jgi:hypothetical protein|uniref:hypothetical protein n=1 Tax=Brevundimonas sp. TaxID=1871086 RepID=UPI003784A413
MIVVRTALSIVLGATLPVSVPTTAPAAAPQSEPSTGLCRALVDKLVDAQREHLRSAVLRRQSSNAARTRAWETEMDEIVRTNEEDLVRAERLRSNWSTADPPTADDRHRVELLSDAEQTTLSIRCDQLAARAAVPQPVPSRAPVPALLSGPHAERCKAIAQVLFEHSSSEWSMADHHADQAARAGRPYAVIDPLRAEAAEKLILLREVEAVQQRYASAPDLEYEARLQLAGEFDVAALRTAMRSDCSEAAAASASPRVPSPVPSTQPNRTPQPGPVPPRATAVAPPPSPPPAAPRLSSMTPVRLPAGASNAPWAGDAGPGEERLVLCPVGQRLTGLRRYGLPRVEGLGASCARFDPAWSQVPPGVEAQRVGTTTGLASTHACATDAWMTGVGVRTSESGLMSVSPICRGRRAPAPGSDSAWRPIPSPDRTRSDCQTGGAVGFSVKLTPGQVAAISIVCAPG